MTEAEWYASSNPQPMLAFLRGKAGDRKLRLFAVACGWRALALGQRRRHLLVWRRSCSVLELAERYADRLVKRKEVDAAAEEARPGMPSPPDVFFAMEAAFQAAARSAGHAAERAAEAGRQAQLDAATEIEEAAVQSVILRDILGPLVFRPVPLDAGWRTPTVTRLAEAVYQEGAFDLLPVLTDALEDAGCTDAIILSHCRGPQPHVRGCWVVDLILAKE
jgi:hypothetical protein